MLHVFVGGGIYKVEGHRAFDPLCAGYGLGSVLFRRFLYIERCVVALLRKTTWVIL